MDKKDFLIELGVEEIPAGYINNTVKKLNEQFIKCFNDNNLAFESINNYSTPRRFSLLARDVEIKQKDVVIERIGPAVAAAYDQENNLTRAAQGFLRGAGADQSDIYEVDSPKGKKIAVKLEKKGLLTEDILKKELPQMIKKLNFPKTMKWNNPDFTFARPIRWILALWGDAVLNFQFMDIHASNETRGNRFLQDKSIIQIKNIDNYKKQLKDICVIVDHEARKKLIFQQIEKVIDKLNLTLVDDEALLNLVTDLVEFPTAVLAQFDAKYLELPEKIVTSTLSQHQKYFSTRDINGDLSNSFIFISNGDPNYSSLIRKGNEKVVKARLEDAEFFFKEDSSKPLIDFVELLKNVTFQEKLGSLYDKTERVKGLVTYLSRKLNLNNEASSNVLRTAQLAKADLVTLMLGEKEFTKLQGYMGWKYALLNGEKDDVALGIYEHYQPRGQNDSLPETLEGALTAIADKMDTVCGIIAAGMMPSSSRDPFALKRAANGVIQIIASKNYDFSLKDLIDKSLELLHNKLDVSADIEQDLRGYFKQRVVWYLQENNIDYDIIESVLHIDYNNIPALIKRAKALQQVKSIKDFIKLVIGFKRVSNIIAEVKTFSPVNRELLTAEKELLLYNSYVDLKSKIDPLLIINDFSPMIQLLIQFGVDIDDFFDEVLVNVENEELKTNRYNLLHQIKELFMNVADISKIVVEGEIKK